MISRARWKFAAGLALVAIFGVFAWIQILDGPAEQARKESGNITAGLNLSGRVTMIDLGATECVPCKMMAPIMEELKEEYKGKADIIFIDVWKDPPQARKYGIQAIPTQIFFDRSGREVYRHVGFINKEQIKKILAQMGVALGPTRGEVPES